MAPVAVAPSPKSQAYEATVPSGSDEPAASTATTRSVGVAVNAATGGWLGAVTVTCCDVAAVPPWLSVTVSVTV